MSTELMWHSHHLKPEIRKWKGRGFESRLIQHQDGNCVNTQTHVKVGNCTQIWLEKSNYGQPNWEHQKNILYVSTGPEKILGKLNL